MGRVRRRAEAGRNSIAWNGKAGRRRARAGTYRITLSLESMDGQKVAQTATLKVRRR